MWCVGESYAGIYVPMLTREVVKGNIRGVKPHINIKVTRQRQDAKPAHS
jgi:carboxypeptidase C (cathepsin A)